MARLSNRFAAVQRLSLLGLAAAPALVLGGCANDRGRFPSLAIRPAERAFYQAQPAPAAATPAQPAPIPADATLTQRLAALETRAREADARFVALVPEVTRTVSRARGAATGSETWNLAQVALARLDRPAATPPSPWRTWINWRSRPRSPPWTSPARTLRTSATRAIGRGKSGAAG
jgi:Meckel syndrome type 1 protein